MYLVFDQRDAPPIRQEATLVLPGWLMLALILVPPLLVFVAAGLWLIWALADDGLGRTAASLAVVALLGGSFAASQRISRNVAGPLMVMLWCGLAAPIWVVFGMVGYALMFGG